LQEVLSKHRIAIVCIFLTVATLAAFWRVNDCDFTDYDDETYITQNSHIQNGFRTDAIRWAFTTYHAANWHPLTWISHMTDIRLFGLNPHMHHLVSLLFHVANTLLLFFVLHRMTKAFWQSAFVAALFALHPLHVESVAWAAERKDVLSTFFWMLTIAAYAGYIERKTEDGRGRTKANASSSVFGLRSSVLLYLAVVLCFALGLMSKPMLVTLPFVLLLLDYWPLGRLDAEMGGRGDTTTLRNRNAEGTLSLANKRKDQAHKRVTAEGPAQASASASSRPRIPAPALICPLLLEKIPLFGLSALSCIVTFIAQQKGGAVQSIQALPVSARISNAFVSYVAYVAKTIWPNNLAIFYPHPISWPFWQAAGAALLFAAVACAVIRAAGRYPYLFVGWLWYAATLAPVVGLVQVGAQARADRYTYIPLTGLFIMAAWGIPELLGKWRHRKQALVACAALTLSCFFIITRIQVGYWTDSFKLFNHALNVTSNNYCAYYNRGNAYKIIGNYEQAIMDYDSAIKIYPQYPNAYNNRGNAYSILHNYERAINDYSMAIRFVPQYAEAYNNRGFAYRRLGDYVQAIDDFSRAIDLNPEYDVAYYGRGNSYYNLGNLRQAISDYDKAIGINPQYADAYTNRGLAYSKLGDGEQAAEDFKAAARFGSAEAKGILRARGINW